MVEAPLTDLGADIEQRVKRGLKKHGGGEETDGSFDNIASLLPTLRPSRFV